MICAPGFPLTGGYVIGPADALLDARTQATILPLALYLLIRITYIGANLLLALDFYLDLAESRDHLEDLVRERTTALQLVNTSLGLAVDHAQAANRAKSAFLASMSHEIRTPLNAVIGMAAMLNTTALTSEQRTFVDTITTGGEALLGVISDILDFSRIESERLELESAPFDLHACLSSAIELVAHAARQKRLVVRYTCAPDVPQAVIGDVGRLRQVLLNLLGNAVKFTDQGAVILDVTSAAQGAGSSQLRITVRDTGIGIAAAPLAQIFDPFVQADSTVARRHGGTGLGLAISRQLVALMGGTIDAVSTPGAGSTFTVRITLTHAPLAALPRAVEPAMASARPLRVLVAEDNPSTVREGSYQFHATTEAAFVRRQFWRRYGLCDNQSTRSTSHIVSPGASSRCSRCCSPPRAPARARPPCSSPPWRLPPPAA